MNIFIVVQECWNENPKLLVQTVLAGAALGMAVPAIIALMFVM